MKSNQANRTNSELLIADLVQASALLHIAEAGCQHSGPDDCFQANPRPTKACYPCLAQRALDTVEKTAEFSNSLVPGLRGLIPRLVVAAKELGGRKTTPDTIMATTVADARDFLVSIERTVGSPIDPDDPATLERTADAVIESGDLAGCLTPRQLVQGVTTGRIVREGGAS